MKRQSQFAKSALIIGMFIKNKRILLCVVFASLLVFLWLFFRGEIKEERRLVINPSSVFNLSASELVSLKSLALGGDLMASRRVASFYEMVQGDFIAARQWYVFAAERGDIFSQYQAGYLYFHGPNPNPSLARYWLQKATDQNDQEAIKLLKELDEQFGELKDEPDKPDSVGGL